MARRTDAGSATHDLEGIPTPRREELKIGCPICSGEIPVKQIAVVWLVDGQIVAAHYDCVFPRLDRRPS